MQHNLTINSNYLWYGQSMFICVICILQQTKKKLWQLIGKRWRDTQYYVFMDFDETVPIWIKLSSVSWNMLISLISYCFDIQTSLIWFYWQWTYESYERDVIYQKKRRKKRKENEDARLALFSQFKC